MWKYPPSPHYGDWGWVHTARCHNKSVSTRPYVAAGYGSKAAGGREEGGIKGRAGLGEREGRGGWRVGGGEEDEGGD